MGLGGELLLVVVVDGGGGVEGWFFCYDWVIVVLEGSSLGCGGTVLCTKGGC